jgi:LDH2 family malate/lactate/ureidoglycolate dehydrogenase
MGHFFGAIRTDGFRPPADVQASMEETYDLIRASRKVPGHDRIYIPGEPELIAEADQRALGIPVTPPVLEQLRRIDAELELGFDL